MFFMNCFRLKEEIKPMVLLTRPRDLYEAYENAIKQELVLYYQKKSKKNVRNNLGG